MRQVLCSHMVTSHWVDLFRYRVVTYDINGYLVCMPRVPRKPAVQTPARKPGLLIRGQKSTLDSFRVFAENNMLSFGDALKVLSNGWAKLTPEQQAASRTAKQEPTK